ncbi:hypothetical protein SIID45300_01474 [Candidatus Magnetaquicoccaceae bacterium FCR-1]|uniref:Prepilin-type N-terminal cleavage/methylation domain-containing protein n=1 Tax=Candidatus Magnetaquiglobus chichijimensis TaxID=3141448 RepID=A0ABQ0C8D0_9PROT
MRGPRKSAGFTLFELILFIVITGITATGLIPLYNNVLSNLHVMNEGMQASYLGWEMIETLKSINGYNPPAGFGNLIEANFPPEYGIDVGGQLRFDRFVQIEGMIPGQMPTPCTGQEYNNEAFKCITVSVRKTGTSENLFSYTIYSSDL